MGWPAAALVLVVVAACDAAPPPAPTPPAAAPAPTAAAILNADQKRMFQPLPASFGEASEAKRELGRMLFHETRLSRGQDISCNTCHALDRYGVDGTPTSTGFRGQRGGRNSPTVWNAAGHLSQFWDGRAPTVEEQAKGPVLNPIEMALADDAEAVAILRSIPGYAPLFAAAFPGEPEPITWDNYAKAVGAFERQLVTPSRYDAWAAGDDQALTPDEQRGALLFMSTGCMACHFGPLLGGSSYQKVGAVKPWPNLSDRGRKDLTQAEVDDMMFKVPSLRNIDKTAPYFHDGQTATLPEAVQRMGHHQLGKELSADEVAAIVTFLKTLTGTLPPALLTVPTLPPSGPKTPPARKL